MTDEQLVSELCAGNKSAVEAMVYRYHAPIYAYLYRMTNSKHQAEDLTQECFLRAIEAIDKKRVPDSLRPWLYRIAANLCKDHWRKSSFRKEKLWGTVPEKPSGESVFSIFEKQADRERVIDAIQELDIEKRNVIILRYYQELKLEEIAGILGIPLSTVKSRLYHTVGELSRLLSGERPGDGRLRGGMRI